MAVSDRDHDLIIEEYKALRAESLRCAQTVATTVWVGITGFFITAGAAVAATRFIREYDSLLLVTLILLVLQSFGASVMFLSDYWRFIRIGIYIRTKIEEQFESKIEEVSEDLERQVTTWRPIGWEHWIRGKRRAGWFPLASLFVLQLPTATTFVLSLAAALAVIPGVNKRSSHFLVVEAGRALGTDLSLATLLSIVWLLDVVIVCIVARVIYQEIREGAGEKLVLSPRVLALDTK